MKRPFFRSVFPFRVANSAIFKDRSYITLWVCIISALALLTFSLVNIHSVEPQQFLASFMLALVLLIQCALFRTKTFFDAFKLGVLLPAAIAYAALQVDAHGVVSAFWCYPLVMVIFILLPLRKAIMVNLALLSVIVAIVFVTQDLRLAIRLTVSLSLIAVFCVIFIGIIEHQYAYIEAQENLRQANIATASHDLKNPLAFMVAKIDAMRDGIHPVNEEQIKIISGSTEYLMRLVEDLQLLTLADVGELVIQRQQLNLTGVLNEVFASMQNELSRRRFSFDIHADKQLEANLDPIRFKQIIKNLLGNSLKYCPDGTQIRASIEQGQNAISVIIEDSGPGVTVANFDTLFERFYQGDSEANPSKQGHGLGLSIVKELIELHGGRVSASASSLGGLCVNLMLPKK